MIKNRKKRTEVIFFRDNECKAIEEYLTEKASQGWMLEDVNFGVFFTFKKVEPTQCRFAVDVFENLYPAEYIEYCEEGGWTHLCSTGGFFIFTSNDKSIVPIQTDEELVFKKTRKSVIVYLIISIIFIFNFINAIKKGYTMGEFNKIENLFILIFVVILISFLVTEVITNTIWFVKAQLNIKSGHSISHKTLKSLKRKDIYMKLYLYTFITAIISNASLYFVNESNYKYTLYTFIIALIIGVIITINKMIKINKS